MPNSTTRSSSPPVYVPGSMSSGSMPGSMSSAAVSRAEGDWPAFIEKTMETVEDYARREPWTFAAWVFGVGFVLGWKLKPW